MSSEDDSLWMYCMKCIYSNDPKCPRCGGSGWLPTTKEAMAKAEAEAKELLAILEDKGK